MLSLRQIKIGGVVTLDRDEDKTPHIITSRVGTKVTAYSTTTMKIKHLDMNDISVRSTQDKKP